MRKTYFLTLFAAILLLVSCGDKSNKITSKQIVKLYNESAEQMNANKQYVSIDTGYYELASASDRLVLEKLAKEGVITYKVERYAWYEECLQIKYSSPVLIYDYYYEGEPADGDPVKTETKYGRDTVPEYTYNEHFMVDVRITPEYRSMIVKDSLQKELTNPDMVSPTYNVKDWPVDTMLTAENWQELIEPQAPAIPHENKFMKKPAEKPAREVKGTKANTQKDNGPSYPICRSMDPKSSDGYEAAKAAEVKGSVQLLAYKITAVKATNIQILTNENGTKSAKALIVFNTTDVTPQGHILEGVINAIPDTLTATFTYYLDKGWTLDNCVIPEIDITNITRPENEAKVDEFNAKEDEEEEA